MRRSFVYNYIIDDNKYDYIAEANSVLESRKRIREIIRQKGPEYLKVIRAKKIAKSVGLSYWPAIAYGPKIDIKAYKIADRILSKKVGSKYGEILNDGRKSYGGWDSNNMKGCSPNFVARAWYIAGCKDNIKFRLQIIYGILSKKGESVEEFKYYVKGLRWLQDNHLEHKFSMSRKATIALGKLKWYTRWAAIYNINRDKRIRIRDLNWAAVKVAQKGHRVAIKEGYAPNKYEWVKILYSIYNEDIDVNSIFIPRYLNPLNISLKTLKAIMTGNENIENFIPAANIATIFGRDTEKAKKFIKDNNNNLHDAGQFTLPANNKWNRKGWAGLASRYPINIKKYLPIADVIEEKLGRVPNNLTEINNLCMAIPELINVVFGDIMLSSYELDDYKRLWSMEPKNFIGIPAPGGSKGIKIDNLHLVQLEHDNILQPLVGRIVNCCQHLHGAAASCARQSWLYGDCAIWVVYEDGKIVAQSFVWRNKKGDSIVLDSVESLAKRESIAKIYIEAAKSVLGKLNVTKVYVGANNYGVSDMLSDSKKEEAPECSFKLEYTDAHYVRLVCEIKDTYKSKLKKKMNKKFIKEIMNNQDNIDYTQQANNVLLEGSGVYCEYCGAEVHPDCEICPICNNDISEWVE